ncbi:YdeI/OmpD-associated family protein [Paraflavitalea sp. CAU 1676]|uniref:YdeI/OmpD-associated family protein n=1 Tax=Paraflavitalea sp. CAU 1676 TaxID=3032598 RepID=UPI0023DAE890|nr:YdeI/OmpD-associated family protein [Paraflavitalea sp. CAU 1676]MDF2191850.1 YdeI/OmpD-associated family protein [Paraflavitalea sp. CAU 1676]
MPSKKKSSGKTVPAPARVAKASAGARETTKKAKTTKPSLVTKEPRNAPKKAAKVKPVPATKAAAKSAAPKSTAIPPRSIQDDLQVRSFESLADLEAWMATHHQKEKGIWVRVFKKGAGSNTISRADALDVMLCHGWIDGVANKYDEHSFLQRFTPRRSKSIWSKKNIDNVARLIKEGRMQPAGTKEIEAAKADGRWAQAYDSPANSSIPDDFLASIKKNKAAYTFFQTLNKTNLFAISWRLQTAKKPETRQRRMEAIIDMLAKGQKFH